MRSRAIFGWLTVLVLTSGLLIGGGIWLANTFSGALAPGLSLGCQATVGENSYSLALDQTENAALISNLAVQRGMPARAASIALATTMQESKLRNIPYGDLDSVGLFQQRPSQDWGSVEQIMDPVYSANAFYDVLAQVPNYVDLPINDAAQIVQRSGFPHAYAQHESLSRAFASALTGQMPQGLNCTLPPATSSSSPETVGAAAQAALGPLAAIAYTTGASETVPAEPGTTAQGSQLEFSVPDTYGWMMAHWALANANQLGIIEVSYANHTWNRSANAEGRNMGWQAAKPTVQGQLRIILAAVPST